jgi:hypothetical protein
MFASQFSCPDCGNSEAYRSRRKNFLEKYILPFLFLKPVRCTRCFRRSNASSLVSVRERKVRVSTRAAA